MLARSSQFNVRPCALPKYRPNPRSLFLHPIPSPRAAETENNFLTTFRCTHPRRFWINPKPVFFPPGKTYPPSCPASLFPPYIIPPASSAAHHRSLLQPNPALTSPTRVVPSSELDCSRTGPAFRIRHYLLPATPFKTFHPAQFPVAVNISACIKRKWRTLLPARQNLLLLPL